MRALPLIALGTMLCGGSALAQSLTVVQLPAEGSTPSAATQPQQSPPGTTLVPVQSEHDKNPITNLNIPSPEIGKILNSIKFCAAMGDSSGRLSCYDEIASRYNIKVSTEQEASNGASQWLVKNDTQSNDYISLLTSGVQFDIAGNKISNPLSLYVRCHNGNPSVYFKTGSSVGSGSVKTGISQDNSNFSDYSLMPSRSGEAFGIWSRIDALNMINYLRDGKLLVVHYTINNGLQTSAHFDISNIRQETESVIKACKL